MRADDLHYDEDGYVDMSAIDESDVGEPGSDDALRRLLGGSPAPEIVDARWDDLLRGAVTDEGTAGDDDLVPFDEETAHIESDDWPTADTPSDLAWDPAEHESVEHDDEPGSNEGLDHAQTDVTHDALADDDDDDPEDDGV